MQTVYCISGLGANEKVFQFLDLSFVKPIFIQWLRPEKDETLQHYALRIKKEFIHEQNPVILGLSLGGMIAVEIAKAFPFSKAIIISSAKTIKEIPFYWRAFRHIPVYKFLPENLIRQPMALRNYFLGAHISITKNYVKNVAENADAEFYRWAVGAILNWENEESPSNVVHIHGMNDNLLPHKFVKADVAVSNGGHLMIIENAKEVSLYLKNILCHNQIV